MPPNFYKQKKKIIKHCLTLVIDFYWGSFDARKHLNNKHKSDLIQYQTGNGLRHASGPIQPILTLHNSTPPIWITLFG